MTWIRRDAAVIQHCHNDMSHGWGLVLFFQFQHDTNLKDLKFEGQYIIKKILKYIKGNPSLLI